MAYGLHIEFSTCRAGTRSTYRACLFWLSMRPRAGSRIGKVKGLRYVLKFRLEGLGVTLRSLDEFRFRVMLGFRV